MFYKQKIMNSNITIIVFSFSLLFILVFSSTGTDIDHLGMETDRRLPFRKFRPDSCKDVVSNKSRVVVTLSSGLEVMCDTETDGGGWTIFQRRINGNLSFYRGWEEYKYGFRALDHREFYLGNEYIHLITARARHELRIDLKFHHAHFFAHYARFSLYGEGEGYRLKVDVFSGNAGDSLTRHHNSRFATHDKGSDSASLWCANAYKGAWWYANCHSSNLNGIWGSQEYGVGLSWYSLTGHYLSATFTEMKFREI